MESHESDKQAKQEPAWGERDLKHLEERLLDERKRALVQMGQFQDQVGTSQNEAAGEMTSWRFHMADVGTETYEREQSFLLASREGRLLWHIDEALRRLYQSPEKFGRCEECGQTISYERLDAIPYVVRCVNCKQSWEEGRAD
jgi:RNA polymerase-binding transcription factor DksA